jgi:hypothetical protein
VEGRKRAELRKGKKRGEWDRIGVSYRFRAGEREQRPRRNRWDNI